MKIKLLFFLCSIVVINSACSKTDNISSTPINDLQIVAAEPFLADITRNVTGNLASVSSLIPSGMDPHAYEPTPEDVVKVARSQLFIINGGGLEDAWLKKVVENAGDKIVILEASKGLPFRTPKAGETSDQDSHEKNHAQGDPHFWLDPNLVVQYVENIREKIILLDPENKVEYSRNAANYIEKLGALDQWIRVEVEQIPPSKRLLVTNHESLGYFADRYGFEILGTIIPSFSTLASPSARQISNLVDLIKSSDVQAIFIESGSNTTLAAQIASETGGKLIDTINFHTLTDASGPAPNYIEMIRYNVGIIVNAIK